MHFAASNPITIVKVTTNDEKVIFIQFLTVPQSLNIPSPKSLAIKLVIMLLLNTIIAKFPERSF